MHPGLLPADGKLKTVQDIVIEVFFSWIKWAVMSRILPEVSSEFWFFFWEALLRGCREFFFSKIFVVFTWSSKNPHPRESCFSSQISMLFNETAIGPTSKVPYFHRRYWLFKVHRLVKVSDFLKWFQSDFFKNRLKLYFFLSFATVLYSKRIKKYLCRENRLRTWKTATLGLKQSSA